MNKTISKNPILRFKLGLRILKAQLGGTPLALPAGLAVPATSVGIPTAAAAASTAVPTAAATIPLAGAPALAATLLGVSAGPIVLPMAAAGYGAYKLYDYLFSDEEKPVNKGKNSIVSNYRNKITSKLNLRKKITKNNKITVGTGDNAVTLTPEEWRNSQRTYNLGDLEDVIISTKSPTKKHIPLKRITRIPLYYTPKYEARVSDLNLNSRDAVIAKLRELKKFYTPGQFKDDGIWGANTEAAYLKFLQETKFPTSETPTSFTPVNFIESIPEQITLRTQLLLPQITYNRDMTRNWITGHLKTNPYQYTGAQRRALRYWLNGDREGLNYDKNLLEVFGDLSLYAKKGAKLVSGNPIERFLQGRNLPTAPSVKERYSGGYRYLIPWMKKVGGPKTSMLVHPGEIYLYVKEVTPYYNDTTYVEIPEHTSFVDVKPRVASTNSEEDLNSPILDKNGWPTGHYKFKFNNSPEYETLKRRFNTAWSLAK